MKMKIQYIALFLALSPLIVCAGSNTNQITGRLGLPVGTEVEIQGTRADRFKGCGLDVSALDGKKLDRPIRIRLSNLAHPFTVHTNTICRFRGCEFTFVVTNQLDKATGIPLQQAAAGRHFEFMVQEVISPDTVKLKKERVRTKDCTLSTEGAPSVEK
jgi:hypothetical protein